MTLLLNWIAFTGIGTRPRITRKKILHNRQKAKQIAADANAVRLFELTPEIIDALMQGKR